MQEMFSANAIDACSDFDGQILSLFDFYEGELVSFDCPTSSASASKDNGLHTEEAYYFAIEVCTVDTGAPGHIGICSLYIIRAEDADTQFTHWGGQLPGIVIQ